MKTEIERKLAQRAYNAKYREKNRDKIRRRGLAVNQDPAKRAARKTKWRDSIRILINEAKAAPCMDCGRTFDPVCMDFDHRPDEIKEHAIGSRKYTISKTQIRAEIAKCDVVCANCHRLRTKARAEERRDAAACVA